MVSSTGGPPRIARGVDDPLLGRQLGEYTLLERIGEGGFGKVYRAHQAALSREAVIKVLHVAIEHDETVTRRFTAEAQVASRLDHPYAAHVYGFGVEDDGLLWIAMELVRGAPLDVYLRVHGRLEVERFVPFFERVCEVVHTAHEQGIVHRDLKPANIMVLSRAGRLLPKLLDFGIAKVLSAVTPTAAAGDVTATTPRLVDTTAAQLERTAPMSTVQSVELQRPRVSLVGVASAETGNEILGSPRYMAPEQWASAREIDARTDLYALGTVAFEVLTGRVAFEGATLAAVMQAHDDGLPKLPSGFPPALDEVLARATARDPSERHASALELASAIRAATGLAVALPQLASGVRRRYVEHAPEPIADAVLALERAENVHALRDAIGLVARAAARWLGVLAISARTRTGALGPEDDEQVMERLRMLRREGLRDREWLDLAKALVSPFVDKPDAHPIPELVACFAGEHDAAAQLHPLLELDVATERGQAQLRARMPEWLDRLAAALDGISFVTEYEVVVARDDRAERFVGARRIPRASASPDVVARDEQPVLIDAEGAAVLVLAPLVQCARPTPGGERELFLLDGPGRHGARLVAPRHGFEIHDPTLWDWFQDALFVERDRHSAGNLEERPYRGLASFTQADAHLFYGREREVDAFVNRLRVTPLLAVVGPSGAGKSSFVQAGALPALAGRSIVIRPGPAPLATLAARLDGRVTVDELRTHPERVGELLRGEGTSVVLVVDQLEELFTLCGDASEREQFAWAIVRAARSVDDRVRVILTLRDDFLMRAEGLPPLREALAAGLSLLGTPKRADLVRILVKPARDAGYDFEDDQLVAEMVDEVAERPGALAMLSFTAASLWELRDRHFRHLSRKAYRAIGGVGGALAAHAEQTLENMPPDQRALVREAFRRLVTADGTRAVLGRDELVQVLGGTTKAQAVIEALVGARLVSASESETGEHVEIAHEALLSAWPRLVEWQRADAEGARLRDQLRAAAAQWHERGRPNGLLWRGDALAELQRWRERSGGVLSDVQIAFTEAALREATRGRRVRRAVLATTLGFLTCALVGALWLNSQTTRERARAIESLAALHQEQGRLALLDGRPAHALVYLAEAYRLGARGAALQVMLAAAARPVEAIRFSLEGHSGTLWAVQYSRDGARIATASSDGQVRLWNARTGALEHVLEGHGRDVRRLAFSPDDQRLATVGFDGTLRIWDPETARLAHVVPIEDGARPLALAYSPDGARIAAVWGNASTDGGGGAIWQASDGTLVGKLQLSRPTPAVAWSADGRTLVTASEDVVAFHDPGGALQATLDVHAQALAITPDGRKMAVGNRDGELSIWDVAARTKLVDLAGETSQIRRLEFSADGSLLAGAGSDSSARVWDVATGKLHAALRGNDARVLSVAFARRGHALVTGSADGTTRVWDARARTLAAVLDGHGAAIYDVMFRPDGMELVTASADGTAKVWRSHAGAARGVREVAGKPERVAVAPDGTIAVGGRTSPVTLWTAGLEPLRSWPAETMNPSFDARGERIGTPTHDDKIHIWRRDGTLLTTLAGQPHPLAIDFSPDGTRLVSSSESTGNARIWDVASARAPVVLDHDATPLSSAAFSPDGRAVVTAGRDGNIRIWDATHARLLTTLSSGKGWVLSAAFDHRGRRIVSAHQEARATIWDARTQAPLGTLEHPREVSAARFSADDALVVTACGDAIVRVWDAARFKLLVELTGHHAPVIDATFMPDGNAASVSWDGTVRVWEVRRDRRTPTQIQQLARCRVPHALDVNGSLTPRATDPTACSPTS